MLPVCSQHNPDIFFFYLFLSLFFFLDVYKREEGTELCAGSSTGEASISGAEHSTLNTHTYTHLQTDADKQKRGNWQTPKRACGVSLAIT